MARVALNLAKTAGQESPAETVTPFFSDHQIVDKATELFLADGDVGIQLDTYARGFITKMELADRLEWVLNFSKGRAREVLIRESQELEGA